MEEEFDLSETFNEWTHDICIDCMKIKVSPDYWVNPTPEFLAIFIPAKPEQELTICPVCIEKIMGVTI